jgi:hypothetical protein
LDTFSQEIDRTNWKWLEIVRQLSAGNAVVFSMVYIVDLAALCRRSRDRRLLVQFAAIGSGTCQLFFSSPWNHKAATSIEMFCSVTMIFKLLKIGTAACCRPPR